MCGIAGLINFDDSYINSVKNSLYHRGPDQQSHYHHKNLHLIHTRLSIQDIKNGEQPLRIGKHIIVFNGEIYNHLELRRRLKTYTCKTLSDTETLLALYIEFGISALDMIDGMFAFIIYDIENHKLILGRDRLGKKPIYFYKNENKLFIASEIRAINDAMPSLEVNESAITTYLRAGFFSPSSSPYKDLFEVTPGHIFEFDINSLKLKKTKYFDIADQYNSCSQSSIQESIIELDQILHKSIKDRLVSSDLDVGAFLSGGIDSSLIIAIASQYQKKIKTFTVKIEGAYDESNLAAITAKKFDTDHYELEVSMDLKNDIVKILSNYGEPFMDSSAIPSYYISREAKKHVTVALNGDGADELFAGYRRYVPFAHNWVNYAKYFSTFGLLLPKSRNKMSNYNYFNRLLSMSSKNGLDQYLSSTTDIYEDIYKFGLNNEDQKIEKVISKIEGRELSSLSKRLILDANLLLPKDLLKKMDIATMSNSLEARSPFLSKYILEWAPKLPDNQKINGLKTKYILRELCKNYSLNEVYNQPKKGFEVPLSSWVENDLKEVIYDSLLSQNAYSKNFINKSFILNLLNEPKSFSREKRSKILWNLFSLEIWHNKVIRNPIQKIKFSENHKKINILFLTTGLGLGGAERVVLDICKNIDLNNYEVSVIGISSQNDLLKLFHNHKIHAYSLNYKKTFSKFFGSIIDISRHIRNHRIEIIHAHMFHTLIIASIIKLFNKRIKVIFTAHNSFHKMIVRRFILWLLKPFRNFDTIFSKNSINFFHKKLSFVIPNGIDIDSYSQVINKKSNKVFTFIVIGRLEYMKNHKFLLNEISKLNDYDFKLLVVGSGILESELKSQTSNLSIEEKVEFLGARDDVAELLSKSDCLLLPSLWEAFPIVLLEAASSKIPIITTSVGSISSFISDENGYLVDLDDFRNAMIEVMRNTDKAKIKSERLFKKVKSNYQIKSIVREYEALYQKSVQ
jgi:asparagine synthase (glutamine-hydrolysing)